jgi:hypothetical protein
MVKLLEWNAYCIFKMGNSSQDEINGPENYLKI